MPIEKLDEENLIEHLKESFLTSPPLVGIGDDCAVIPYDQNNSWLITTDALAEGIHFLKEQISANDLGYKTIAVNVSDIAAMGGSPCYAFLSVAMPKNIDCQWVKEFIAGIKEGCQRWNISLLGGDTIGSKRDLFINLTMIGSAKSTHIKYRHQAKSDDIICVSGFLGYSAAGLHALQSNHAHTSDIKSILSAHFRPNPQPLAAAWLASKQGINAMMDISDGLNCDLQRLLKSSHKGAVIEVTKLPLSKVLLNVAKDNALDPLQLALTGGEDYCLLMTISAARYAALSGEFAKLFATPLYAIGHITDDICELKYCREGEFIQIDYNNYNHFA